MRLALHGKGEMNELKLPPLPDWAECERIRDLSDVEDALSGFLADSTGDNATCVVRAVLMALADGAAQKPVAECYGYVAPRTNVFFTPAMFAATPRNQGLLESGEVVRVYTAPLADDKLPGVFKSADELFDAMKVRDKEMDKLREALALACAYIDPTLSGKQYRELIAQIDALAGAA